MVLQEGQRQVSLSRNIDHHNLDTILAVGYRVRSTRGTQFRRWATERLREYLVKGFTLDDERLKNPPVAGSAVPDRFDELLERIRDIRASERRMSLRVREIFAMAADYVDSVRNVLQGQGGWHRPGCNQNGCMLVQQNSVGNPIRSAEHLLQRVSTFANIAHGVRDLLLP